MRDSFSRTSTTDTVPTTLNSSIRSSTALTTGIASHTGSSPATHVPSPGNYSNSLEMERVKLRATKTTSHPDHSLSQNPRTHKEHRHVCEERESPNQTKAAPHPIVHPDVMHSQMEENSVKRRFSEDSRPMFSPVPRNSSSDAEGEDSPRPVQIKNSKEKTAFPSIHVEKCELNNPTYAEALVSETYRHSPESDEDVDNEVMSTSQSSGGLNVPSPYLHRKSDGRLVLLTQGANPGMLSSWSRSEGNLPDAIRRSQSTPGSHSHLLDIKYRPDWQTRPTIRQYSDVSLYELKREHQRSPATPRRLTARLEALNLNQDNRSSSASNLQSP